SPWAGAGPARPRSRRAGSLGLGATKSETIKRVVVPAALPGIVGALLLTASRAIGETMIVVLAAGVAARLTINPFEAMTTITVKIVNQLTGDLEFTSPQTLVAFARGMTLFVLTLGMNVFALFIVRKYREQYEWPPLRSRPAPPLPRVATSGSGAATPLNGASRSTASLPS